MSSKRRPNKHKMELIGGPLDGSDYTIKALPELFELNDILELDPTAEAYPSKIPYFYARERYSEERKCWLYIFIGSTPY